LEAAAVGELRHVPTESIRPNPRQPRTEFDAERLDDLAASIRVHGVLQPLLVTPAEEDGEYILLAGERRLRASLLAEAATVPVRVIKASDVERLEFALIENVQREDLNAVEEARAYEALANSFGYSQEQIAARVGKSRVAVANTLRLLKLSEQSLADLQRGALTPGHARAILMLPHPLQQEALRKEILDNGLNVRQAETRAREIQDGAIPKSSKIKGGKRKAEEKQSLDVVSLQEKLLVRLGCPVTIRALSATAGRIEIRYQNLDDMDRILEILGIDPDE
jgi:ParB family chromosome partitioning protein